MTHWAVPYVGVPFVESGFERSGCHCWGLVCLVYREVLGIELPRHDTVTRDQLLRTVRLVDDTKANWPWSEVTGPRRDFDVVLMGVDVQDEGGTIRRFAAHVGIAVGTDRILHVERRAVSAVCVKDAHQSVCHRIVGAWRHERIH